MLGRELGFDVNPVATILGPILDALQRIVLVATGWPLPPS